MELFGPVRHWALDLTVYSPLDLTVYSPLASRAKSARKLCRAKTLRRV